MQTSQKIQQDTLSSPGEMEIVTVAVLLSNITRGFRIGMRYSILEKKYGKLKLENEIMTAWRESEVNRVREIARQGLIGDMKQQSVNPDI